MRVVFLTHYYPPEVGAPQTRIAELAERLAADGVGVVVHTGFPHYPAGRVIEPYRNRPLLRESGAGGVPVVRSAIYPAANRGFGRRLASHLSLSASALATAAATGPADVVVAETPPLFMAAAGVIYARVKRAPLVLNVADLWPASAVALGVLRDRRAIALAERLEAWAYSHAAAVIAPTAGSERVLAANPAVRHVERIGPAVDVGRFAAVRRAAPDRPLKVLYAGTVGLAQGVDVLVEAAAIAGPQAVEVTIAGGGAGLGRVREAMRARDISNVRHRGTVAAKDVPGLYDGAHVGAVLLRDRPLFDGALPTKLFECMAAGRAVVLSGRGEAAELIRRSGAGIVAAPEDPHALAAAFVELAAEPERTAAMGEHGRRTVSRAFERGRSSLRWKELLERVVDQRASR